MHVVIADAVATAHSLLQLQLQLQLDAWWNPARLPVTLSACRDGRRCCCGVPSPLKISSSLGPWHEGRFGVQQAEHCGDGLDADDNRHSYGDCIVDIAPFTSDTRPSQPSSPPHSSHLLAPPAPNRRNAAAMWTSPTSPTPTPSSSSTSSSSEHLPSPPPPLPPHPRTMVKAADVWVALDAAQAHQSPQYRLEVIRAYLLHKVRRHRSKVELQLKLIPLERTVRRLLPPSLPSPHTRAHAHASTPTLPTHSRQQD